VRRGRQLLEEIPEGLQALLGVAVPDEHGVLAVESEQLVSRAVIDLVEVLLPSKISPYSKSHFTPPP
jgi:hypothetical protein